MRHVALAILLLLAAPLSHARMVDKKSYAELMAEADFALIVHCTGTRDIRQGDSIVPVESDADSLVPVISEFNVLAVLKGDSNAKRLSLCHYKYRQHAEYIGNGPLLVNFATGDGHSIRSGDGPPWSSTARNDYVIFLKQDDAGRWTFVTGQYDAELSVRQIIAPLPLP